MTQQDTMRHKETSRMSDKPSAYFHSASKKKKQKEIGVVAVRCLFDESRKMSLCPAFHFGQNNQGHWIAESSMHPTVEQPQRF